MTNQKTGIVAYRAAIAAKYLDVKNYCLKNILAIFVGYCLTDRAHLQVDHLYLSDHERWFRKRVSGKLKWPLKSFTQGSSFTLHIAHFFFLR